MWILIFADMLLVQSIAFLVMQMAYVMNAKININWLEMSA
jgi:hypothetical protein